MHPGYKTSTAFTFGICDRVYHAHHRRSVLVLSPRTRIVMQNTGHTTSQERDVRNAAAAPYTS